MADYIGIDIGTTYCRLSIYKDGKPEIIHNEFCKRQTPTYISFTSEEIFFGKEAKEQMPNNPKNTFFNFKNLVGKKYLSSNNQNLICYLPFEIREAQEKILFGEGGHYTTEEIFLQIFKKLLKHAQNFLGKEKINAVITIPIFFYHFQRKEIRDAAKNAGFEDIALIPVTSAAAFFYAFNNINIKPEKNVLIFDLGGGFLDVAIVQIEEGLLEAKSVSGKDELGGIYFDIRLAEFCAQKFREKYNIDIKTNKKATVKTTE